MTSQVSRVISKEEKPEKKDVLIEEEEAEVGSVSGCLKLGEKLASLTCNRDYNMLDILLAILR